MQIFLRLIETIYFADFAVAVIRNFAVIHI